MNPYEASDSDLVSDEEVNVRHWELRRVDAVSAGKLMGALYGTIALILGGIYAVIAIVVGIVGAISGEPSALIAIPMGIAFALFLPIMYGILGAIGGAIMAAVYSFVAGRVGGLKLDLIDHTI